MTTPTAPHHVHTHHHPTKFPSSGKCLWPSGDPRDENFRFCGAPNASPDKPYCAEHLKKAYVAPTPRR